MDLETNKKPTKQQEKARVRKKRYLNNKRNKKIKLDTDSLTEKFVAKGSTGNWIVEKKVIYLTFFFTFRRIWERFIVQQRERRMEMTKIPNFSKNSFYPPVCLWLECLFELLSYLPNLFHSNIIVSQQKKNSVGLTILTWNWSETKNYRKKIVCVDSKNPDSED